FRFGHCLPPLLLGGPPMMESFSGEIVEYGNGFDPRSVKELTFNCGIVFPDASPIISLINPMKNFQYLMIEQAVIAPPPVTASPGRQQTPDTGWCDVFTVVGEMQHLRMFHFQSTHSLGNPVEYGREEVQPNNSHPWHPYQCLNSSHISRYRDEHLAL